MRRLRAIRPTWRAVGLGLAAVGLGLIGSRLGAGVLVWFAVTITALLLGVAGWIIWEIFQDLRVRLGRELVPAQLQVGANAATQVTWPTGTPPRLLTSFSDTSPSGETGPATATVLPQRRGGIILGPALIHRRDPFGLFRWTVVGRPSDHLTVWPRTDAVDGQVFHRLSTLAVGSRGVATPDLDDLTLREYQHGDPLSRVYWKRLTPDGSLLVRHDEPARNPAIDLVLIPGTARRTDWAVDLLASAVEALCTPEREVRLLTPTGVAAGDRADLLTALALIEPGPPALPPEFPAEVTILAPAQIDQEVSERIIAWAATGDVRAESVFIFPAPGDYEAAAELLGAFTVVEL